MAHGSPCGAAQWGLMLLVARCPCVINPKQAVRGNLDTSLWSTRRQLSHPSHSDRHSVTTAEGTPHLKSMRLFRLSPASRIAYSMATMRSRVSAP